MPHLPYMIPAGAGEPRWSDETGNRIDINVVFPHLGGDPVRYTAANIDPGWEHSEEIFARAKAGEFGKVAKYVAPPVPVPASISDRQFFHALAKSGAISQDEARAAIKTGDLPAVFLEAVAKLPEGDQFDAMMLLEGSTSFERAHPLTGALASFMGLSSDQIDDLFRAAAKL